MGRTYTPENIGVKILECYLVLTIPNLLAEPCGPVRVAVTSPGLHDHTPDQFTIFLLSIMLRTVCGAYVLGSQSD